MNTLLNDQLLLGDDTGNRIPEHQKLCDKGSELLERLKDKLNDEEKNLLESLVGVLFDEGTCYAQSKFAQGYQLGVLMTMKVFKALDSFIIRAAGGEKMKAEKETLLDILVNERMRATLDISAVINITRVCLQNRTRLSVS